MDPKVEKLLHSALEAQRQGNLKGAEEACLEILAIEDNQPGALQFLGLIAETKGDLTAAEDLMRRSLKANPAQPHVFNNLANILHKKGDSPKAITLLKQALALAPDYAEGWFNLAKIYFNLGDLDPAREAAEKAKRYWRQKDPKPHNLLGNIFQRQNDYEQSARCFEEALSINPNYFNVLHNYGLLLKLQQKPEQALKFYRRALEVNSKTSTLFYNMANVFINLTEFNTAIEFYQKALDLKPDSLPAHEAMNEIIWREGLKDRYLVSYPPAIEKHPENKEIRLKYIEGLLRVGKRAESEAAIREFTSVCGPDSRIYNLLTKLQISDNNFPDAVINFKKGIDLDPASIPLRKDYAKLMILNGDYEGALDQLEEALGYNKFHQELIAYQALCWRLLGDPREKILNNYDDFVKPYKIEFPKGYGTSAEFNAALDRALDFFHTSKMQPSDQSLRGGTQTLAELLFCDVPEIRDVRRGFEKAVSQYISELADDPEHPLLSRKSTKFTFAGSWSIRLKDQGFHVNHVHPEGWISSSYYVSLPDVVKSGVGQQGWIKFGESPLKMGAREVIRKTVQPEVGMLVLFPSYMFHGTLPFTSKQPRTTLPADIIPLPE